MDLNTKVNTKACTSSYKPTIWKRYVDDTFTILDRGNVDDFLQHLNNQQPSIRFTMETENNNKLAFLDTAVSREPDGRLTTSVYRKPNNMEMLNEIWKAKLWAMYHVDVQRFTASNRLILTVFAGKYVSLLGETNRLRHRSSLKALSSVSLFQELTRGRYDDCCCSTFATHFLSQ